MVYIFDDHVNIINDKLLLALKIDHMKDIKIISDKYELKIMKEG